MDSVTSNESSSMEALRTVQSGRFQISDLNIPEPAPRPIQPTISGRFQIADVGAATNNNGPSRRGSQSSDPLVILV